MPAVQRYLVTQTREVEVVAESLSDAARLASEAFAGSNSTLRVQVAAERIRETDLTVRKV